MLLSSPSSSFLSVAQHLMSLFLQKLRIRDSSCAIKWGKNEGSRSGSDDTPFLSSSLARSLKRVFHQRFRKSIFPPSQRHLSVLFSSILVATLPRWPQPAGQSWPQSEKQLHLNGNEIIFPLAPAEPLLPLTTCNERRRLILET